MMQEQEIWKPIIIEKNGILYDYTGLYEVSNLGRVRSLDRIDARGHKLNGKILKTRINKDGYVHIGLRASGEKQEQFKIHRLVATMFIPNPDNLPVVNHKDECRNNNCVDNLEWCTQKYNANYGTIKERLSDKSKGEKNPMYGKHHTDEARQKCRESSKKAWENEEYRRKVIESRKGKPLSEEHKRKIGESLKGKPKSEEMKKKLSKSIKGKPGKPHTEEWKQNMSERVRGELNPRAKKVICLETKQVFGTAKDAAEWCGKGGITSCCRGKSKTCGGYHWQYLEDYKREQRMNIDIKNSQLVA